MWFVRVLARPLLLAVDGGPRIGVTFGGRRQAVVTFPGGAATPSLPAIARCSEDREVPGLGVVSLPTATRRTCPGKILAPTCGRLQTASGRLQTVRTGG